MPAVDNVSTPSSIPKDRYWWKDEAEKIPGYLREKRRRYFDSLEEKGILARVERNLLYYYGDRFEETFSDMALKMGGEEGEIVLGQVNMTRAFIRLLITYIVESPPALDTIALNPDVETANDTVLGDHLVDYYTEVEKATKRFFRLVETSLLFSAGYIHECWNPLKGKALQGNLQTREIYYEGDIENDNLNLFDVYGDMGLTDWDKAAWVCCRKRWNVWDLAEAYPGRQEDILMNVEKDRQEERWEIMKQVGLEHSDQIWCYYAYHKPTPALPNGRKLVFVGDAILADEEWDLESLPVIRLVPEEVVGSADGYSSAFDLQGLQEALDMMFSTILTDHNALGGKKIWMDSQESINIAELESGIKVIQSDSEPKVLSFAGGNAEALKIIEFVIRMFERITGMNPTASGTLEPGVKSGVALSVLEARATQFSSTLVAAFYQSLEDWGTVLLRLLKKFAKGKRIFSILGVNNERHTREFVAEDLENIDRVAVKPAPAATRTLAGRIQIGTAMMETGLIKEPEAFLDLMQTGDLSKLTAMASAQRRIIARENEEMLRGIAVQPTIIDDHRAHMRAHSALLDHPETRQDPVLYPLILTHIQMHADILISPEGQEMMIQLGYQIPPPPMMPPGGGGGMKPPKALAAAVGGGSPGDEIPPGGNSQGGSTTE